MHIIARKPLLDFGIRHPNVASGLNEWYRIMAKSHFASFNELRTVFPHADKVGEQIVFNISGNKCRLIAVIHFNRQKCYIRHVLTHADYDKGAWKK